MAEPCRRNYQARECSHLEPSDLIAAKERLQQFMTQRWPQFREKVEWPVEMKRNHQLVRAWVDSLWEGENGFTVIDHKTFPGREADWEDKALGYAGQLLEYQTMVEQARGGDLDSFSDAEPPVEDFST